MSGYEDGGHATERRGDGERARRAGRQQPRAPRDVVVLSHLRWDFVFQRPQQVMSRLASRWRIWFVEEPVDAVAPAWSLRQACPGVTVCRAAVPGAGRGFTAEAMPGMRALLRRLQRERHVRGPIAWLYTPLAAPLIESLDPALVVYDCMDELSNFLDAPPTLAACEDALLRRADVVFTGGPSLFRAKRARHPAVHCFPSSVDVAHFAVARDGCAEAPEQAGLPRPRLGFFGVIDERLDLPLLDAVAASRPDWQLVMVGPVAKIDEARLPRRPNIRWVGMQPYAGLPSFLVGWDLCLLPFARNAATKFISPTKTLEYMAAERPIVSTPIRDVAEPYGRIVYLADTAASFVAACERALASSDFERGARAARMRAVLRTTSWDDTARRMQAILEARTTAPSPVPSTRGEEGTAPC